MGTIILAFFIISIGLGYFLVSHDRGPREPVSAVLTALVFGITAALAASIIENIFLPNLSVGTSLTLVMAGEVGVIEELIKFLPLAFFIYNRRYFNELTDGPIYFGICGLGFGWLENVSYTLTYGVEAGTVRLLVIPFFHAATSGIIGYYLARYKLGLGSLKSVVQAVIGIVLVHAAYDYLIGLSGIVQFVTAFVITLLTSIIFFRLYRLAGIKDVNLKQVETFSTKNGPLPDSLKRWSWAAFLMNWLWSITHNSWLGLAALVLPVLALLLYSSNSLGRELVPVCLVALLPVLIVLGLEGNAMAWRNRQFSNLEEFLLTEKIWTRWGIGLAFVGAVLLSLAWLGR